MVDILVEDIIITVIGQEEDHFTRGEVLLCVGIVIALVTFCNSYRFEPFWQKAIRRRIRNVSVLCDRRGGVFPRKKGFDGWLEVHS